MACSACGGKARRPLRTSGGRPVQQQPTNTGSRATQTRSIMERMRYTGKK